MTKWEFFWRMRAGLRLCLGLLIVSAASTALACSTVVFGLPERPLVAYSYDFGPYAGGILIANAAGVQRRSIMETNPDAWRAEYASLTFTQFGPGMPMAGMNRAGLIVSLMWNDDVLYPEASTMPVVNELEFIQRLLDRARSVDDALRQAMEVSIQGIVPVQFLLTDRQGRTAILMPTREGLDVLQGTEMPVPALTNSSYRQLVDELGTFAGFGGDRLIPSASDQQDPSSHERFAIAALASQNMNPVGTAVAFAVLDDLANPTTRWQFVFDPLAQRVAVRSPGSLDHQTIDLEAVDFSCTQAPSFIDLPSLPEGQAELAFVPITVPALRPMLEGILASFGSNTGLHPGLAGELAGHLLQAAQCSR